MLECVVNVSEGRDAGRIAALTEAVAGSGALLDVHSDRDHHRSVFTFAAEADATVVDAVHALAARAVALLDLRTHTGVHPRLGVVDVVPYVALAGTPAERDRARTAAVQTAGYLADSLGVPVFFYGAADPLGRSLPRVRAEAFRSRHPDRGPAHAHQSAGATAVGVRPPLLAVNALLTTGDVSVARAISAAVRERDGGLPGVRALGFALASHARAQVSMNLVDLGATGLEAAWAAVEGEARRHAVEVVSLELVGLIPASELARCSAAFVARTGLSAEQTIEARVGATRLR